MPRLKGILQQLEDLRNPPVNEVEALSKSLPEKFDAVISETKTAIRNLNVEFAGVMKLVLDQSKTIEGLVETQTTAVSGAIQAALAKSAKNSAAEFSKTLKAVDKRLRAQEERLASLEVMVHRIRQPDMTGIEMALLALQTPEADPATDQEWEFEIHREDFTDRIKSVTASVVNG